MLNEKTIRKLPKVDLHCHLDGSVRTSTIRDLAKKSGAKLPTENLEELEKYVRVPESCRSLTEFLNCFNFFYDFLKSPEAVERIAYELCEDISKENIKYIEVRFAPPLQITEKFNADDVVRCALSGLEQGARDFKIKTGAILCFYRSLTEEQNDWTLKALKKYYGKGVVGVDLAGDESRYPFSLYKKYFIEAKKMNIPITVHAGEAAGPESIKAAIELGIQRIGHGTRLKENKDLMKRVIDEQIPLEVCVTSNVQTQTVPDYPDHPVKFYFDNGVKITLNTDDRSVSGIDLSYEIKKVIDVFHFTDKEIIKILQNGFKAAFLPEAEKKELLKVFSDEITNLGSRL